MKLRCLPLLILLYLIPGVLRTDQLDKVADLLKQGNVAELSKMFAANVEITLQADENMYSKVQAGMILDKFLSQNKPRSVRMLHKVNSSANYLFAVVILSTDNGPYRIAYTLKETEGSLMLIELRVETEKV